MAPGVPLKETEPVLLPVRPTSPLVEPNPKVPPNSLESVTASGVESGSVALMRLMPENVN